MGFILKFSLLKFLKILLKEIQENHKKYSRIKGKKCNFFNRDYNTISSLHTTFDKFERTGCKKQMQN